MLSGIGLGNTQQSITFAAISPENVGTTITLTATASSGLTVTFSSTTPGVCTVSGTAASLISSGLCTIQAYQVGNATYAAAATVTQSFAVLLQAQTITFNPIATQLINFSVPVSLTATASSGLTVSFISSTPAVCSASSSTSTATLLATGTCTIQASQPGDGVTYAAAPSATQTFAVEPVPLPTSAAMGAVQIGSSSAPVAVTLTFTSAATLGAISVLTQGASGLDYANAATGTCNVGTSYMVGNACTVNVTLTPAFAGARDGAVVLMDGAGNVIATTYLQGTGVGPQVAFLPSSENIIVPGADGFYPRAMAVDGSNDVFFIDEWTNQVLRSQSLEAAISRA